MQKRKFLRTTLEKLHNFADGVRDLLHPRTLALAAGLSALYLIIAAIGLFVIALGLHITVTFTQTLSVYLLSLAISLIFPLPVDIGVLEISMLGAFAAVGVNRNAGLGASLLNRILSIGASIVIATVALVILNRELRAALRSGRKRRAEQDDKGKQDASDKRGQSGEGKPQGQPGQTSQPKQPDQRPGWQSAPQAQPQPIPAVALITLPPAPMSPVAPIVARQALTAHRRATLTVVGIALAVVVGLALTLQMMAGAAGRHRSAVPPV